MRKSILTIVFLAPSFFLGCDWFSPSPPLLVQITVEYPGAGVRVVEDVVCAPILQQIIGIEGDATITSVSRFGRADIYVQPKRSVNHDLFLTAVSNRAQLAAPILPDKAKMGNARVVNGVVIPTEADAHDVDQAHVNVDRDKVRQLGVPLSTVFDTLDEELGSKEEAGSDGGLSPDSAKRLKELTVEAADGTKHRLADFATVEIVREPNIRIRREPPTGGGK